MMVGCHDQTDQGGHQQEDDGREDPVAGVQDYGVPEGKNSVRVELPAYAVIKFSRKL